MAYGTKIRLPKTRLTLPKKVGPAGSTYAGGMVGPPGVSKGSAVDKPVLTGQFGKPVAPKAPAAPPAQTGPPAAPAAPPAPTPLPWDTQYESEVGGYNRTRNDQLADITTQQGLLGGDWGYSYDPVSGAVAADPSNPFSRAALLKQSYERSRAGSSNSMAARGQLYSGANQNAQNYLALTNAQQGDQLQRQFRDVALGLIAKRTGVNTTADNAIATAGGTRIDRAIAYANAHPQDPGTQPGTSPGVTATGTAPSQAALTRAGAKEKLTKREIAPKRKAKDTPIRRKK